MTEVPEKLGVSHKAETYVGLPASMAVAMALMEATGIRQAVDEACPCDPQKKLTPGMAVKAMIAPTFNIRNKDPLYLVQKAYRSAPVDRIFGRNGLTWENLNDDALGRALDALASIDLEGLFHRISEICVEHFGFESHVYHMDCTNWSFYGIAREARDGIAVPAYPGHPKDGRRDLLHYALHILTDSNRIVRAMIPADGNSADSKLDAEMLDLIERSFTEEEIGMMTVVADSKLMNRANLKHMLSMGVGFVSRCPKGFGKKAQQRVKDLIRSRGLFRGEGVRVADVNQDALFGSSERIRLRFVAVIRDEAVEACLSSYRCRAESIKARYRRIEEGYASDYQGIVTSFESVRCSVPEYVTVRPRYYPVPGYSDDGRPTTRWRVEAVVGFDEGLAKRMAEDEATLVLVTNLPCSERDSGNARDGVTADGVRRLYDEEYVVEHSFRFMKSGLGIDTVFLQTPERENAMMFVMSVAALVSNIADAVFLREGTTLDGRQLTMHGLAYELQGTIVKLTDGKISVMQPADMDRELFSYTDVLGINPQLLLGCRP